MRTITREYSIFPIHELSADAQQKAYYKWIEDREYSYSSDNRNTMEQFEELFNIDVRRWSYDSCTYNYSFFTSLSAEVEELCGVRLAAYIINNHWHKLYTPKIYWGKTSVGTTTKKRLSRVFRNADCTLTGYCADCAILEPIYDFLKQPDKNTTYLQLMDKCLASFFRFCRDDMQYTQSEENFHEESNANDWEYLSNGTLFN